MSVTSRKYPPEITRKKVVDWCNKAERCQWDVRNKLIQWNTPTFEREQLISELISMDLLNEKRYAEAFTHDKALLNQWGRRKIVQHLKAKGISGRNITDALGNIGLDDEKTTIESLIKKKELHLREAQLFTKKAKIIRFLISRGFEYEAAVRGVENYFSDT